MAFSHNQSELLKLVDKHTEYAVHGFIHDFETQLKLSKNIPMEIIKLCLLFFFNKEYFELSSDDMSISGQQKDIITKYNKDGMHNIAIGLNWIPSMNESNKYKWTIEVIDNNKTYNNGIVIGIIGKIPAYLSSSFCQNHGAEHCYHAMQIGEVH